MKRISAFVLAAVFMILIAACGTDGNGVSDASENNTESSSGQEQVSFDEVSTGSQDSNESDLLNESDLADESEGSTADAEKPDVEDEGLEKLSLLIGDWCKHKMNDEYAMIASVSTPILTLDKDFAAKYPKLQTALQEWSGVNKNDAAKMLAYLAEASDQSGYAEEYTQTIDAYVVRADERILSVNCVRECFDGDRYESVSCLNLDSVSGERIMLDDVVVDMSGMPVLIADAIEDKYGDEFDYADVIAELKDLPLEFFNWTLGYRELTVYFSKTGFLSGGSREYFVTLPIDENKGLVREKYIDKADGGFVIEFPQGIDAVFDIVLGDGRTDVLSVGEYKNTLYVNFNEECVTEDEFFSYGNTLYLVTPDNEHFYIYVESISDNDYRTTYVYSLNGGIKRVAELSGDGFLGKWYDDYCDDGQYFRSVFNDPSKFVLSTRVNTLGTMMGKRTYHVDRETGEPIPEFNYYELPAEQAPLVTKVELEVLRLPQNEKVVLPVGTELVFLRGDNESYVDMADEAGNEYRISFEFNDWRIYVGGYYEEDCFDGIMYAG